MSITNHAEHWRVRAIEAHATVDQLDDPESKASMLVIAKEFEKLTDRAEKLFKVEKRAVSN
jgi:hypothetical protein